MDCPRGIQKHIEWIFYSREVSSCPWLRGSNLKDLASGKNAPLRIIQLIAFLSENNEKCIV
jgi:hypothetical protein